MLHSDVITRIYMSHIRDLNLNETELKDLWNDFNIIWQTIPYADETEQKLHEIMHKLVDPIRVKKEYQKDFADLLKD